LKKKEREKRRNLCFFVWGGEGYAIRANGYDCSIGVGNERDGLWGAKGLFWRAARGLGKWALGTHAHTCQTRRAYIARVVGAQNVRVLGLRVCVCKMGDRREREGGGATSGAPRFLSSSRARRTLQEDGL
jgi:hypothetical protein